MGAQRKLCIVVVGLDCDAAFALIYLAHPDVERVALCDVNEERLHSVDDQFGIVDRFARLRLCSTPRTTM